MFLARSKKLCNDVRSLLRNLDGDSETEAITVGDFLSKMELAAEGDHSEWAPERRADFDWFCKQVVTTDNRFNVDGGYRWMVLKLHWAFA